MSDTQLAEQGPSVAEESAETQRRIYSIRSLRNSKSVTNLNEMLRNNW